MIFPFETLNLLTEKYCDSSGLEVAFVLFKYAYC